MSLQTPTPASGATIQTTGTTPGAFIERGSGKLSLPIVVEAGSDEPDTRVFVYLKNEADGTCGQNLPDTPGWAPLRRGEVHHYTVTGFQVFSLPCEVASIRAVLHRRASRNLNTEITAGELIAEATLAVRYSLR